MLHLLDSLHSWMVLLIVLSLIGGGTAIMVAVHVSELPDDKQDWAPVRVVATCSAIIFALSTTLAIFLPTPKSMGEIADRERRQRVEDLEADKKAAKLAYCIANPGKCK